MEKQYEMLETVMHFHTAGLAAIDAGVETVDIFKLPVREEIARAKYIPQDEIDKVSGIRQTIDDQMKKLQTTAV